MEETFEEWSYGHYIHLYRTTVQDHDGDVQTASKRETAKSYCYGNTSSFNPHRQHASTKLAKNTESLAECMSTFPEYDLQVMSS